MEPDATEQQAAEQQAADRFALVAYDRAKTIVEDAKPTDFLETHRFVVLGDHHQNGAGFIGPKGARPLLGLSEQQARERHQALMGQMSAAGIIADAIATGFTSEDVLGEVVVRRTDVLLAKEPQWTVEPDDAPAAGRGAGRGASGDEQEDELPSSGDDPPELTPEQAASLDAALEAVLAARSQHGFERGALLEEIRPELRAWIRERASGHTTDPVREAIGAALARWWDAQGVHDTLKSFADGVSTFGRTVVAIAVPPGRLVEATVTAEDGGGVPVERKVRVLGGRGAGGGPANAEEALESVFVDVLLPDAAARVVDPQTRREAVVAHFPGAADPLTGTKSRASAQLSYVAADGQTVLRIVEAGQRPEDATTHRMDLGAVALMVEGRERRRFLTPSMRQQQKALNTASTEMRIVNDEEGFPRRLLLNAMPPGEWVTETDPETGRERDVFKSRPFELGPGEFAHVTGEEMYDPEATDEDGNPVVTGTKQASATTLPAGDPENYVAEMAERRQAILRQARQLYALLSGDADASGESRVQALYEMMNDASSLKSVVDRVGRHVLACAWNLACHLAGEPERMLHAQGLRMVFDCRITLPQPTSAQVDSYVKLVEKQIWAPSTAQAATGIDDTEAEDDRIEREGRRRADALLSPVDRAAVERTQVLTQADRRALNPASEATRADIEGEAEGGE